MMTGITTRAAAHRRGGGNDACVYVGFFYSQPSSQQRKTVQESVQVKEKYIDYSGDPQDEAVAKPAGQLPSPLPTPPPPCAHTILWLRAQPIKTGALTPPYLHTRSARPAPGAAAAALARESWPGRPPRGAGCARGQRGAGPSGGSKNRVKEGVKT